MIPQLKQTRRGFLGRSLAAAAAIGAGERARAQENPPSKGNRSKIISVKTYALEYALPQAIGNSIAYYGKRNALLVKITTDTGLVGWGETAVVSGVRAIIEGLGKQLIGRDPLEHRKLWYELWGSNFGNGMAMGALDIALHDLRGKVLNLSVADLYGGRMRDRVPAYAAAMSYPKGVEPEDRYPEEARALVKRGFRAMKMRLGRYSARRDMGVASAVRAAVGPDVKLMVDGNGAYTLHRAIAVGRELEGLGFYFFEEPLPQARYTAYEVLTSKLDIPIAAGEVLNSRAAARELIARRAMRIIQPDVSLCGGVAECLFIAETARAWGIHCIPHCWGGALVIAATLQVLSLLPNATWAQSTETPFLELDVYENPFRDKVVTKPVQIREDGAVDIPTGPGLGVEIDEDVVRHYAQE